MYDYVKIWQKMLDWEHWEDLYCPKIMLFLALKAKQRDTTYKGEKIKRGQVVAAGRGEISRGTNIPDEIVRKRIYRMAASGDLSIQVFEKAGSKFTVITLNNFEEYQADAEPKKQNPSTKYQQKQQELRRKPYSKPFEKWFAVHKKGAKGGAWIEWQKTTEIPPVDDLIITDLKYQEYCKSMDRPLIDGERWIKRRFFDSEWTHEAQGTKPEGNEDDPFKY